MPDAPPAILNDGYEAVAVDSLELHPDNVNQGDIGAIHESMQHNGFFGAIYVQKSTRRILSGNHTWQAARQRGMDTIPVIWLDVDDDRATRIMLAANRTARLGHDDPHALAHLLEELNGAGAGLDGTGYDGDDLDDLLRQTGMLGDRATAWLNDLTNPTPPAAGTPAPAPPGAPDAPPAPPGSPETGQPDPEAPNPTAGPGAPVTTPPAPGSGDPQYFQLAFALTAEQRDLVADVLRRIKAERQLGTQMEALVALAEHYRRTAAA